MPLELLCIYTPALSSSQDQFNRLVGGCRLIFPLRPPMPPLSRPNAVVLVHFTKSQPSQTNHFVAGAPSKAARRICSKYAPPGFSSLGLIVKSYEKRIIPSAPSVRATLIFSTVESTRIR